MPKERPRAFYALQLKNRLRKRFCELTDASSFELFVRQFRYAIATSMALVVAVTSSGYAYASPSVAHGDILYPIKRTLESVRLSAMISSEKRAIYIARLSDRRAEEAVHLMTVRKRPLDDERVQQSFDEIAVFSDDAVVALGDVHSADQVNRAFIRVQDRLEKILEKIARLPVRPENIMIVLEENAEDLSNIRPSILTALQTDQETFRVIVPRKSDVTGLKERYEYQLEKLSATLDFLPKTPVLALPAVTSETDGQPAGVLEFGAVQKVVSVPRDDLAILAKKIRDALDRGDFETARRLLREMHKSVHVLKIVPRVIIDTHSKTGRVRKIPPGFDLAPVSPIDPRQPNPIMERAPSDEPVELFFAEPPVVVSPSPSPFSGPSHPATPQVRRIKPLKIKPF